MTVVPLDRTEHFIHSYELPENLQGRKNRKIRNIRPTNLKKLLTLFLPHTCGYVCSFALKK